MPRRFLGISFAVLVLALLAVPSAGAASLYEVTVEAKLTQDWSLHGTGYCVPVGSGTSTITLESRRPFIAELRLRDGVLWDLLPAAGRRAIPRLLRLVGSSAMSGSIVMPPGDPDDPCPRAEQPCVGRPIKDAYLNQAPVLAPRFGYIVEANGPAFAAPPGRGNCFEGYIRNFSGPDASGDPPPNIDGLSGRLGTPAEVAAKPKVFTVVGRDHSRYSNSGLTYDTRRELRITFREVELRARELVPDSVPVLHRRTLRVEWTPPSASAERYEWQMKRSHQFQWTNLGKSTEPRFDHTFRLAGHFRLRAIAYGARVRPGATPRTLTTRAEPLEVRFPTWREIVADQAVDRYTKEAWALTLSLTKPESRQEVGFWILLDTCTRNYGRTGTRRGPPAGPDDQEAEVNLGARPADSPRNPPAVEGCATYTVASFHTHPPTEFRRPPGDRQEVGPSDEDQSLARDSGVPAVVFDYIANPLRTGSIPFGYPMKSPAKLYQTRLLRRPTPRR